MNDLIAALQHPDAYDHPVETVELIETHISWVLLTGQFAYKIKKPVDLGFVNFTTLEKRRIFCDEELRLNSRFTDEIYLEVVPITGSVDAPRVGGDGPAIEYAVKMRQFSQDVLLDRLLDRDELLPRHIDLLAEEVAEFHQHNAIAGAEEPFGEPESIWEPMAENFRHLASIPEHSERTAQIGRLADWAEREFHVREDLFRDRKRAGRVRECHGDLHLRNMILQHDRVLLFDCIEFNASLRWIDVISEIAFTVMDLGDRGRDDLAARFLNAYLQQTGDYAGLQVLRFYLVYRATVRAKVAGLRLAQEDLQPNERDESERLLQSYLDLAEQYTQPRHPQLLITHGLSGSGKSTITQELLQKLPAVRMRSDVERKRLFAGTASERDMYTAEATAATYEKLAQGAGDAIGGGFSVIIDATFLQRRFRDEFRRLAEDLSVALLILDFTAPVEVLRERIAQRDQAGGDASDADLKVLELQLENHEPLDASESADAILVDSAGAVDVEEFIDRIRRVFKSAE